MRDAELRELARRYSIQLTYEDAAGKTQRASRDSILGVLKNRLPTDDLREALRMRRAELAQRVVEPVIVVWDGSRPHVALPPDADAELQLESGETRPWRGREPLPIGYYTLRVTVHGKTHESAIFVAPRRAHAPQGKSWGIFAPVYAMQTADAWGIGDLGTMRRYNEWIHDAGGGIVATLPMNAIDPNEDPSPYSPVSRLFWNELFLDIRRLPEFRADDELPPIDGERFIDWKRVAAVKGTLIGKLAERFTPDDAFEAFARAARDYAAFRASRERRPEAEHYHLYAQYRMAQQMRDLAAESRRRGLGLYLDFPLGVHPHGYDAWTYRDQFAAGVSAGAPPDLFFTKGQNWGFPPLDPDAIRASHHAYFRECVRHQLAHAGVLRIDHVMGLHRLFWIPQGGEAKDGVYVRYPAEELYAVLLIESRRAQSVIVGEDLGTVPKYVPQAMERHGIRRMHVVQYEAKPDARQPLGTIPAQAIASINTHDMPTFAGFWSARDVDDRLEQGLLDERGAGEEREKRTSIRTAIEQFLTAQGLLPNGANDEGDVLEALLRLLGGSDAEMVLVNIEDLWGEREPVNYPGLPERSWRRKMRVPLEAARADDGVSRLLRAVDEARRKANGDTKQEGIGSDQRRR